MKPERLTELVELWEGDCRKVMPKLKAGSFAAVITDPPYGTEVERDGYGRRQLGAKFIAGDADLEALAAAARLWPRLLFPWGWAAVFVSPKRRYDAETVLRSAGFVVQGEVVWDKGMAGLGGGIRYQHETALLCTRSGAELGKSSIFSVIRATHGFNGNPRWHQHEKPLPLLRQLVQYTTAPGDPVLDCFAGSGGLGIAAAGLGRPAVLVELDAAHAATVRSRVRAAEGAGPGQLFADSG